MKRRYLAAHWQAPKHVHAYTSTRDIDCAKTPDNTLIHDLHLPSAPLWLNQVHGNTVCELPGPNNTADAAWTQQRGVVLVVRTADCLPILLTDVHGEWIAAIHAGWRSLAAGIIGKTIAHAQNRTLMAWLGPAISMKHFEVGDDVRAAFGITDSHANLYTLASAQLKDCGVHNISCAHQCTFAQANDYFSHRRAKEKGRMGSFIWYS